jgi:glycosyltransferase involved in cell wall biosynthesis
VNNDFPKVSIVIPTLNAANVLYDCLESIVLQDYPKDKIEIIISDGGSEDGTLALSEKYLAKVVENKLKTGEAGKAAGVRVATGEYVALVDSDNILPTSTWLKDMIEPLQEQQEAVGSEPWEFTWREKDGFITRYCALIGMNDPLVHFLGNYDKTNLLSGTWTKTPHEEYDMGDYLVVDFDKRGIPTIGANGTVFRTRFLKDNLKGDYLFDIDILAKHLRDTGYVRFIKVKNGIVHTFCENDVKKFARKQRRRIKDYLHHKAAKNRDYDWKVSNVGLIKFVIYCLTVFPLFSQSLWGFLKKRDRAWFFHPLACEITLWEYSIGYIQSFFKKGEISREGWGQ